MELQNHENLVAHVYVCNIHKYIYINMYINLRICICIMNTNPYTNMVPTLLSSFDLLICLSTRTCHSIFVTYNLWLRGERCQSADDVINRDWQQRAPARSISHFDLRHSAWRRHFWREVKDYHHFEDKIKVYHYYQIYIWPTSHKGHPSKGVVMIGKLYTYTLYKIVFYLACISQVARVGHMQKALNCGYRTGG